MPLRAQDKQTTWVCCLNHRCFPGMTAPEWEGIHSTDSYEAKQLSRGGAVRGAHTRLPEKLWVTKSKPEGPLVNETTGVGLSTGVGLGPALILRFAGSVTVIGSVTPDTQTANCKGHCLLQWSILVSVWSTHLPLQLVTSWLIQPWVTLSKRKLNLLRKLLDEGLQSATHGLSLAHCLLL